MTLNILTAGEKKKILSSLKENFGIEDLPYLFIKTGKGKVRLFTGAFSRDELKELSRNLRVEFAGLYALREEKQGYRISFDGLFLFKDKISEKIIELDDEQSIQWLRGKEVEDPSFKGFAGLVALKNRGEIIGTSITKDGRILNFVPKERRIK